MLSNTTLFTVLIVIALLGCGLMAGIFFAFSNFVMQGLARLRPESGVAAMQAINVTVLNPLFLGSFMGTALVCLALAVMALVRWQAQVSTTVLAGSLAYLVGNFVVTAAFNVPRNDALARVDAAAPEAVAVWQAYLVGWTRWNHVRTVTAFIATALFALALIGLTGTGG